MHRLLFIHKILFYSTCFELHLQEDIIVYKQHMVLSLSIRVLVACRYVARVRTDCRGKFVGRASYMYGGVPVCLSIVAGPNPRLVRILCALSCGFFISMRHFNPYSWLVVWPWPVCYVARCVMLTSVDLIFFILEPSLCVIQYKYQLKDYSLQSEHNK